MELQPKFMEIDMFCKLFSTGINKSLVQCMYKYIYVMMWGMRLVQFEVNVAGLCNCLEGIFSCCRENRSLEEQLNERLECDN